jgi:Leucine-rich repeat (LRR) protein
VVTNLTLNSNRLTGSIPSEIGNLTNLTYLYLSSNQLSGSIPPEIGNLTNLKYLYLSYNQLSGSIPPEIGNLTNLQYLYLSSNQLSGSIPPEIGNLTNLIRLGLSSNQLSGSMPAEIGNLVNLNYLYLYSNQLSGYFPEFLITLTNMFSSDCFQCYGNNLELADNASSQLVNWLNTHCNQWKPLLPIEREALIALYNSTNGDNWSYSYGWKNPPLHTDGFALPGTEAGWSGVMISKGLVTQLYLHNRELSGTISPQIGNLTNLTSIDLNSNSLSGCFPESLVNLSKIESPNGFRCYRNYLELADNASQQLVNWLNTHCNQWKPLLPIEREALIAFYNSTNGDTWTNKNGWKTVPLHTDGFSLPGSEVGWYGVMVFNGVVSELSFYSNNLCGFIPPAIGNLTNLTKLNFTKNQLSGSIPLEIGNLTSLKTLYLNSNQLSGYFPESLVNLTKILKPDGFQCYNNLLELDNNASQELVDWLNSHSQLWKPISAFEREILITFYNATNGDNWNYNTGWKTPPLHTDGFAMPGTEGWWKGVTVSAGSVINLDIQYNKLNGSIPPEIGNLFNLKLLNLSSNQLSGSIPPEIGNLTNLTYLSLSSNQLSGPIPSEIGNLTNLTYLSLYSNQLSGSISSEIGNLTKLQTLYLYYNHLTGPIPSEIGNLTKLKSLCLDSNQLSGPIPAEIGNLTNLSYLNLNSNQLSGSIPSEIGNLTNMQYLSLYSNQLNGYFPESLANLTKIFNGEFRCGQNCLELAPNSSQTLINWLNTKSTDWKNQFVWFEDLFVCWSNGLWQRKTDPLKWSQFSKQQVEKIVIANTDGTEENELIAHFTAANEIWIRYNNDSWQKQLINTTTLIDFTMGDINGDGKADFIGSWSDMGLWWRDSKNQIWTRLSRLIAEKLESADFDSDGKDDILAVFPTDIWIRYSGNGSWVKQAINRTDLIALTVGDVNGDKNIDIIGSWAFGLWWQNGVSKTWTKLSAMTPDVITTGDIYGDGKDEIIGNFDSIGVWVRKSQNGVWEQLSKNPTTCLATGCID